MMVDCSWIRKDKFLNIKIHYFLLNGALACVVPFLPIFAKEIGISAVSVGVIYCILPLVTMVSKPFFGAVADYFNNLKSLLIIFLVAVMLSSLITFTIPRKQNRISSKVHCTATGTRLYFNAEPSQDCMFDLLETKPLQCYMQCRECVLFQIKGKPASRDFPTKGTCKREIMHSTSITLKLEKRNSSSHFFSVKSMTLGERDMNTLCFVNTTFNCSSFCEPVLQECYTGKENPEYSSDQFWLFFIFAMICVSSSGVVASFSDAICFNELAESHHLYGKQRLWGTIGWGVFSPFIGYINDLVSGDSFLKAYQPGAILQFFVMCFTIAVARRLKTKNLKFSQNVCKDVLKILKQFNVIAFILSVLMIGASTSLIFSYLYWHLSNLGANKMLFGVIPVVQCLLGELPIFFFAGKIIKKLGHFNVLLVSLISFGIRFFLYSCIRDPWVVLPIELLQGPTFGLFYSTMASYANVAALPGTEVTMQGLFGASFELGMSIGNLLGGLAMHSEDGSFIYFWAGVIVFTYSIIHVVFSIVVRHLKAKETIEEVISPPDDADSFIA